MKFVSWNVNGLRACMGKGFMDSFRELDADFFCLQETKLQEGQITMDLPGYHQYWCYAQKKGYSGTAIFTRYEPRSVRYGLGIAELDTEGRVITLEYDEFFLVTCYTPNAQRGLARIDHRLKWEEAFRSFLVDLDSQKPVILCGDLNVAHQEIDLKNPASNRGNAGFSDQERNAFTALLDSGFTDSFRHLYPDKTGAYSWWSYMFNARQNNAGWRIDYFVVSNRLSDSIHDATIHPQILGSDHCPVGLDLNISCNGAASFPSDPTHTPQTTIKADEESSVSLGRILLSIALAVLLLGGILWAPRFFSSPEPTVRPTTEMVIVPVPEAPLIAQVIDRTGSVTETIGTSNPLSSALPKYYFVCGEERFLMEQVLFTGPSKSNLPNYYIQLSFNGQITQAPTVNIRITHYSNAIQHYTEKRFYYKEDGSIGGCFIYGFLSHTATVTATVSTDHGSETVQIPVTPLIDLGAMTTPELIRLIDTSGLIQFSTQPQSLLQSEPTLKELVSRTDAISALLEYYRNSPDRYQRNITSLLDTQPFQDLMTDEQRQTYTSLRPQTQPLDATDAGIFRNITLCDTMPTLAYLGSAAMGGYILELDGQSYSLHSTAGCSGGQYTYCLRIDFSEDYCFAPDDVPELSAARVPGQEPDTAEGCIHVNYFYQDNKITGCFIYGHLSEASVIQLMLVLHDNTQVSESLYIPQP